MFSNIFLLLSCVLVAHAQSITTSAAGTSSTPGLDSCILNCVSSAATSNGCITYTNLTCVCTSTAFQEAAATCLSTSCNATDIATADALQQAECAALSSGVSSVASSTTATSATSSGTGTSTSTSTSNSGAMGLAPISFGTLVGTLVASAGALVGAAFVL